MACFVGLLMLAALLVKFWWLPLGVSAGGYVTYRIVKAWHRYDAAVQAAITAEAERVEGLRTRADQQHAWALAGDPRGTYGETTSAP